MKKTQRVIVIGLDGLDPGITESLVRLGELPNLARLQEQGGFSRVATTFPPQTPVAWSTFATGVNPGGHGIFDFLRRDPKTYLPQLALNRYEQKNPFLPPKVVNLRRGQVLWDLLTAAGVPSVILRCPCTYPPEILRGRMLAGMGVPDLRGGLGTATFYTSAEGVKPLEGENIVRVQPSGNGTICTKLLGPLDSKTHSPIPFDIAIELKPSARKLLIRSAGRPSKLEVEEGRWSDWLKVTFKVGLLQSVRGMVRFSLRRLEPVFELYASPIQFDPDSPMFPISSPPGYARELAAELGDFHTAGMPEDHGGLVNGRIDEQAFLDQCTAVWEEREAAMLYELARMDEGLFFCLFDTPDRIQHMFWRFREKDHPANRDRVRAEFSRVIEEHYRACDATVGKALEHADDRTLFIVLSDHGFNSFRRGLHLNTWLYDQGLLALRPGIRPNEEAGDFFRQVDWGRTKAYSLGLGGMYLNLKGREDQGIVASAEAEKLKSDIARQLTGLRDEQRGSVAVRNVVTREAVYRGPYRDEAPDLIVNLAEGYRISWGTALGAVPEGHFEDNIKRWAGDHIIHPSLVPGVLFMNRSFAGQNARLVDLAPTILSALGVPKGSVMEGESLLP